MIRCPCSLSPRELPPGALGCAQKQTAIRTRACSFFRIILPSLFPQIAKDVFR